MGLSNMAIKNIKGNINKYVMYYISNIIVVIIFFIFANFLLNPKINSSNMKGTIGETTSILMYLCEFVIIVFTLVFTNYANSNFLKSREKEFGLLSMFGLTKGQIRLYVMIENIIISLMSIITGILIGILFSKLFFMAVASILDIDGGIPFYISLKAVWITILCFTITFQFISLLSSRKIKSNNIAKLLKGSRIAKPMPKFSKFKSFLAVALIGIGYYVAIISKGSIFFTMFPILLIVIIGTYFLFSQLSVYISSKLTKNKNLYYKGINMVTLSQVIYKLKDNSKILFITCILSGITLAASITVYSFQKMMLSSLNRNCPQDMSITEQGFNSHNIISPDKVESIIKKHNFDISDKVEVKFIRAENTSPKKTSIGYNFDNYNEFNLISLSDYNRLADQYNKPNIDIKNNEAVIFCYDINDLGIGSKSPFNNITSLKLSINNSVTTWKINKNIVGGVINPDRQNTNTVVVSDKSFKDASKAASDTQKYMYYGYNIKQGFKAASAVNEIKSSISSEKQAGFSERILSANSLMQFISVFLFIGTFVAIIFFIATGSILYFKMFNEIQKDRLEFISLKKIGMTHREIEKIISLQLVIMFFFPLVIAVIHAAFAVKSLGLFNLGYFLMIFIIYLVLQCVFYLFARWMYVKQINSWQM